MTGSDLFVDEPQEIRLGSGVEVQSRFVQENYHVRVLLELCESCDERNKPSEAVGTIIETVGEIMPVVHHIQLQLAPQPALGGLLALLA